MRPPGKVEKQRRPIGRPVVEEPDDDPDFVRGPVKQPEKAKAKATRSGKKRKAATPAEAPGRRPKRPKIFERGPEWDTHRNPLIELLGVQDDAYFRNWDSEDDDMEDEDQGEYDEEDSEAKDGSKSSRNSISKLMKTAKIEDCGTETEDSVTEDDDDPPVPVTEPKVAAEFDINSWISKELFERSQDEERDLQRALAREEDPSATESDSDSLGNNEELDGAKPLLDTVPKPPRRGPHILDYSKRIKIPGSINRYLRPYQREGVAFMYERYKRGRGGILGDDMGLGKTIQVISFLTAIMGKHADDRDVPRRYNNVERMLNDGYKLATLSEPKPVPAFPPPNESWPTCLLVVPGQLITNWDDELKKWSNFEFAVYDSEGNPGQRAAIINDFRLGRLDIVLVSRSMLLQDIDQFYDLDWSVVVVDEVHIIKNRLSKTLQALSSFKCICRFGMTGTAIQNDYEELWTILNWSSPGKVGTVKQWKKSISEPLKRGQSSKATKDEKQRRQVIAKSLVHKLLPVFFVRRTKEDLLKDHLPKKIDLVAFCPLTKLQMQVYRRFLAHPEVVEILRKDEECDCGSEERRGKCCHPTRMGVVLQYITIFIKIANSLVLICPALGESPETFRMNQRLQAFAFPNITNAQALAPMDRDVSEYCGKWKVLEELLQGWNEENAVIETMERRGDCSASLKRNKVLIFTKSKKLLEHIGHAVDYAGYKSCRLHGDMKPEERRSNIKNFLEDPEVFIFLITTQSGGVGLNLVAANKVVIFDPNWNPAHDLQAMDRAFRIGQTRDVEVYRLLSGGCIEELIYKRQLYKQQMMKIGYEASMQPRYFEGVQGVKEMEGELFGVKNLFALSETGDTKHKIEQAQFNEELWRQEAKVMGTGSKDGDSGWAELAESPEDTKKKVMETLKMLGVLYAHSNQEVLQASEAERAQLFPKRTKRKSADDDGNLPVGFAPSRRKTSKEDIVLSD